MFSSLGAHRQLTDPEEKPGTGNIYLFNHDARTRNSKKIVEAQLFSQFRSSKG
jgi:hypothetical protein